MRIAIALLLCAAAVPTLLRSAPIPGDKAKELYYPTRVGARWVYQTQRGDKVEEVVAVKSGKNGTYLVTVGFSKQGEVVPDYVISVSEQGFCIVSYTLAELTEPFWMLKLPHNKEDSWKPVLAAEGWSKVVGSAKASGPETVEVPASKFQAIRVEMDVPHPGGRLAKTTFWYAPGVGKIKERRGSVVDVLKSFEPGKP